jgi:hypothetical protein
LYPSQSLFIQKIQPQESLARCIILPEFVSDHMWCLPGRRASAAAAVAANKQSLIRSTSASKSSSSAAATALPPTTKSSPIFTVTYVRLSCRWFLGLAAAAAAGAETCARAPSPCRRRRLCRMLSTASSGGTTCPVTTYSVGSGVAESSNTKYSLLHTAAAGASHQPTVSSYFYVSFFADFSYIPQSRN